MSNKEAKKLLERYQAGQCTEAEKAWVDSWYGQFNEDEINIDPEIIQEWGKEISSKLPGSGHEQKRIIIWPLAIAASIALTIGAIFYLGKTKTHQIASQHTRDIAPGGNHAKLTLANGKIINLSDAKKGIVINANKFAYNDGSTVTDSNSTPGIQTVSTPRGGQYQVILPDGSKVWLNAATTLRFPQSFAGSVDRIVELSGEAYFEVAKDKMHPFIVKTQLQRLQVLGTHFNISAYTDENITRSTLLEGSIRINNATLLKPGEQADNTGSAILVMPIDTDYAVAWKNGEFMFRKESLASIMRKVGRWYDVEVIYEDPKEAKKQFGGEISRFTNVAEVLHMLELTGQVHFRIEERRIMVLK